MRISKESLLAATTLATLLVSAPPAIGSSGENMGVTQMEILALPQFCWKQMGSKVAKGPEFSMPKGCGPGTNHYCPGLIYLTRAKQTVDKRKQRTLLSLADTQIRYTLEWIKDYPDCPIRGHVNATKTEIDGLRRTVAIAD